MKGLQGGLNNLKDMHVKGLSAAELEALFLKHDADGSRPRKLPGVDVRAHFKTISDICHLFEVAFV